MEHNHIHQHDHEHCHCHDHSHEHQPLKESKYEAMLKKYRTDLDDNEVKDLVFPLLEKHLAENNTLEVKKFLFNCIDLTTLKETDNDEYVMQFTKKVNKFDEEFPELKNVAAICVYPCFAEIVRDTLEVEDVNVACVSGGFPSSQTYPEVKIVETALAIKDGADEIDIVISVGKYLAGDYENMCDEIDEIKETCRDHTLKVILETGALKHAADIKKAALLSLYAGGDFIKTSTGKIAISATYEAAYVMCQAIKEYYEQTGIKKGFKAAGGINTVQDAICYYTIVKEVLGEEWLDNKYFRLGTSRLANLLLSEIVGKEVKFF
jgi:deoxyribose-phosphate aldolase